VIPLARAALLSACTLSAAIGCSEQKAEGERNGTDMRQPSEIIPPLDVGALQRDSRAFACDEAAVEARVDALLAAMTLEQKAGQMHGLQPQTIDDLYHAGELEELGIPPFKMVDGPRGVRAGTATAFPVAMARGASWDPELERRVGIAMGLETAAKGGNVLLAPTVNLLRHPGWGRAQETYGEDPFHVGLMGLGFIGGVQTQVMASVKHFAVNSIENTRFVMSANLEERTLREVYLPHFRRAVVEGRVASVMSAYNRVNGPYCAENAHLLRDILKGEWGFRGFVESDWFLGVYSTVPSALAGLDLEMPMSNHFGPPLVEAVRAGELDESVLDEAVRRMLRQKLCFGLDAPEAVPASVVESPEHRALALETARRSIVLLRNEGGALPLDAAALGRLAVVGALADFANLGDRGSSGVTPTSVVTPYAGLASLLGPGRVELFETDEPSESDLDAIAEADVAVIVVGLTFEDEGEFIPLEQEGLARGGDRADLALPQAREALVRRVSERARRTVVVLEAGSAVLVEGWVEVTDALLMAWYPGMEGGTAIAEVLTGAVNPSGRLPVSFARRMEDLPPWDITSEEVEYALLHGYGLLQSRGAAPRYAFGFGLSYHSVELAELRAESERLSAGDTVRLSVDVTNVGEVDGDEVIQLYAGAVDPRLPAPPRRLGAFSRVHLEAGSTKTAQLEVPVAELGHWDAAAGAFVVASGDYRFEVGTSSESLPLSIVIGVE
jgi:beta-glucosidase